MTKVILVCIVCVFLSSVGLGANGDFFMGVESVDDSWELGKSGLMSPKIKEVHCEIPPSSRRGILDIVYRDKGKGRATVIVSRPDGRAVKTFTLPLTDTGTFRVGGCVLPPHSTPYRVQLDAATSFAVKKIAYSTHGRNTFFSPSQRLRVVKFDPWCSKPGWGTLEPELLVEFWKDCGFNAVFMVVQPRSGAICFPSKVQPDRVDREIVAPDFIERLVRECKSAGMALSMGVWGGRDDPMWEAHPEWRQQTTPEGKDGSEKIICPNSPYYDEYLIPLYKEIHERYGIASFWLQEFWNEWVGYNKRGCYCSFCKKKSRGNLTDEFWANSLLDVLKKLQWEIGESAVIIWENPFGGDIELFKKIGLPVPYADYFTQQTLYPDQMVFKQYIQEPVSDWAFPWALAPGFRGGEEYLEPFKAPTELRDMLIMVYGGRGIRFRENGQQEIEDFYLALKTLDVEDWGYEYDAWPATDGKGKMGPVWRGIKRAMAEWEPLLNKAEFLGKPDWLIAPSGESALSAVWENEDGSFYAIVCNLVLGTNLDPRSVIDFGSDPDTFGSCRIDSKDWKPAQSEEGRLCRTTVSDGKRGAQFFMTLPESVDSVLTIDYLDAGEEEVMLALNFRDGGTWVDYEIGSLALTDSGKWSEWKVKVPGEQIALVRDASSALPGKQVNFSFWDGEKSFLLHPLTVGRIAIENYKAAGGEETIYFKLSAEMNFEMHDLRTGDEWDGDSIPIPANSARLIQLTPSP